ncbi:MAG: FAD-dependent oxidoreductase, partial [Pseudomonadota bacterium]
WSARTQARGFPLSRHTVFFSDDYAAEFEDVFARRRTPSAPTVYVCAQDRDDAGARIDGAAEDAPERLLILTNAPPDGDKTTFDGERGDACEDATWAQLERCGLTIARTADQVVRTTPTGFDALFPGTGGALYGRASHGWAATFQRPGARSAIRGLYLAGGAVHPGPGIPMAALSGAQAAAAAMADRDSTAR